VFFYLEDRERTLDSPIEKVMLSIQTMADEMEREKARQRMVDTMTRKARAGHVTGGKCFGYENVVVTDQDGQRSHVERRVNEAEAAVVRRIFELSADGAGYSRIAKLLNAERAPCPSPQQARPTGWAPTSVKSILERSAYRGEVIWNRTKKRDRWGQRRHIERPDGEWLRHQAPDLRIVSDDLWNAAHERIGAIRQRLGQVTGGRLGGRRYRDVDSGYLLAGFARCTSCGGALGVVRRRSERGASTRSYGCLAYNKRGPNVCQNRLTLPMERVDAAVLEALAGQVLTAAVVDAVVAGVLEALQPTSKRGEARRLRVELEGVERELKRLAVAIAKGGALSALLEAIQERQAERDRLVAPHCRGGSAGHALRRQDGGAEGAREAG
jgi:hypothetical protein